MKDCCLFYRDWFEGMKSFPSDLRLELYEAIISYSLNGELPTLSEKAQLLFSIIRLKIERDDNKYEARRERNRANGSKGGRPQKPTKTDNNPKNPVGFSKTDNNPKNPKNPVGGDNDNVSDNDNGSKEPEGSMGDLTLLSEGMSDSVAVPTQPKTFREQVVVYFNEKMKDKGIKPIRNIENKRKEMLQARVREYSRETIYEMIDKAAASPFLNGDNNRGFVATFDWLIRPNNFPKVLEGNYDKGRKKITDVNDPNFGLPEDGEDAEDRYQETIERWNRGK